jgi:hypothetical protein
MTTDEIEAFLQAAFNRCDAESCPLSDTQKQILLQVVEEIQEYSSAAVLDVANPLDELTDEELQTFLEFVKTQEEHKLSWKMQLLNDWLHNNDSGAVQFIRDRYGLEWLNRVDPIHFEKYASEDTLKLKVGSKIEVCNALWEWVQDSGPCQREWFSCTVVFVDETFSSCTIRFNNGSEYEIQGLYEWNRYNWRWASS